MDSGFERLQRKVNHSPSGESSRGSSSLFEASCLIEEDTLLADGEKTLEHSRALASSEEYAEVLAVTTELCTNAWQGQRRGL